MNETISIGFAITGSFCTFAKTLTLLSELVKQGYEVQPKFYNHTSHLDNRFTAAETFCKKVERITGNTGIYTIQDAEPIGPKAPFDALVIAPCTGNTMAKLVNGITDTPVLMAAKAHLRNEKPLVISISSNDNMGMNFRNLGMLYNAKNVYFVPFGQDDHHKKPCSLVAHVSLIPETIEAALHGRQLQPVLRSPF